MEKKGNEQNQVNKKSAPGSVKESFFREKMRKGVEENLSLCQDLVQKLYDHPEIGGKEFYAHDLFCSLLEDRAFPVERHVTMETGFLAHGGKRGGKPVILIPAEFDALPGIGHGCGHNLFGAMSLLAFLSLSPLMEDLGAELLLAGTPAEENLGGKVLMKDQGIFDDVDCAIMIHPGTKNSLGSASQALYPLKFEFFGKSAHGCKASEGASALDPAVLTYLSINLQRQFIKEGAFIHGIIKDGGEAANVIPDYTSMEYYFRADTLDEAKKMGEEAKIRAKMNAKACGCELKTSIYECIYGETILNEKLAEIMREEFIRQGRDDVEDLDTKPLGSTDVGAISYLCPTVQATIKIAEPEEAKGHSREMAGATISSQGQKALQDGGLIIGGTCLSLVLKPELLEECWKEEKAKTAKG